MKKEFQRKIDELGRVVIPAELLKLYGFKPGDTVWFTAYDVCILFHSFDCIYNEN